MRYRLTVFLAILFFAAQPVHATLLLQTDGSSSGQETPSTQSAGLTLAVSYIEQHSGDAPEWAVQGLHAAGSSVDSITTNTDTSGTATDLELSILALAAKNSDPSVLVTQLDTFLVSGHIGTSAYLNDDTFGILAYRASGRPSSDATIQSIASYLTTHQHADGGWGLTTLSTKSDVDDTAAALEALVGAGEQGNVITNGLSYLRAQQNTDGGFPYRKTAVTNSASTSWAAHALDAAGENINAWQVNGISPIDALLSLQQPDGSFLWQAGTSGATTLLTSYAVIALAGSSLPVAVYISPVPPPSSPPPQNTNTQTGQEIAHDVILKSSDAQDSVNVTTPRDAVTEVRPTTSDAVSLSSSPAAQQASVIKSNRKIDIRKLSAKSIKAKTIRPHPARSKQTMLPNTGASWVDHLLFLFGAVCFSISLVLFLQTLRKKSHI